MGDTDPIDEMLAVALQRAAGPDREAWIEAKCAGDARLERELRGLIEAHEGAGRFMAEPLLANRLEIDDDVRPGAVIGRYELRELIGEGGFGQVWRAVQHEPVRREVALKLLEPGRDSRVVVARFDRERQTLALMDHPNIARVFDADSSRDGRLFFVMELIDGVPLLDYCNRERLDTRRRLELFLDVCHAIQHAHSKGVIHRDIKPSNVLVAMSDGHPMPKIIDFGIANLTVGVVRAARAESAAVAEAEKATTEKEIAEAINLFLRQDLLAAAAPSAAEGRGRDARIGDVLDAASRRIDDAGAPGGRFEDKPHVEASIRYTLGWTYLELGDAAASVPHLERSMHLRRTALGDDDRDTLQSASLLGAVYKRAGRADDARALLSSTLETQERVLGQDDIDTLRTMSQLGALHGEYGRYDEAEAIFRRAIVIEERIFADDELRLETMFNLSILYMTLGRYEEAEPLSREILEIATRTFGPEHPRTLLAKAGAADALSFLGRNDEAEPMYVSLLESRRRVLGEAHPGTLEAILAYGNMLVEEGRFDEAEPLLEEAVEGRDRTLGADHQHTLITVHALGALYVAQGRYAEAIPLLERSVDGARRSLPAGHWIIGAFVGTLGEGLAGLEQYEEAEAKLLEAHTIVASALGPTASPTIERIESLAHLYDAWEKPDQAAAWEARLPNAETARDE